MSDDANTRERFRFPPTMRLRAAAEFKAVYDGRVRFRVGPLMVWGRPNELPHSRLGMAIGRKAGPAVSRNRMRRRLREAFRLSQHEWPGRYDVIVSAQRHESMPTEEYRRLLVAAVERLDRRWHRNDANRGDPSGGTAFDQS